MGGAERSARKRRQNQSAGARAVAQARGRSGGGGNRTVVVTVIAVVVIAAVVIGGVIWSKSSSKDTEGQAIAAQPANPALDSANERNGVVVVSGKADAKAKIDIYADFLCPYCGQLQKTYGTQMEQQIEAGNLQISYHMIPLLASRSDPPGYSLDAANAALCAADEGKFTAFHDSLFAQQPEEGQRGYDKSQLIKLGQDLGITSTQFSNCVNGSTYDAQLNQALQTISADPNFQGTPTILHNGQSLNWQDPNWLTTLVGQG
ncbi:thioredoxin domain-containing protein [Amycolatopsis acidicola]|uniref:Thioredoxin domain-containing protein n=1 Tax=Amycolatopsis acidicola TaxID=2596893 RepID=A0A5N0VLJ4_9PSEU|nr:thioredoxin domain-containing protein [Amycolatopsis acidicola]KAA9165491.1 thioredoxin domain-containing protein [Amycolatopsis acidicola]